MRKRPAAQAHVHGCQFYMRGNTSAFHLLTALGRRVSGHKLGQNAPTIPQNSFSKKRVAWPQGTGPPAFLDGDAEMGVGTGRCEGGRRGQAAQPERGLPCCRRPSPCGAGPGPPGGSPGTAGARRAGSAWKRGPWSLEAEPKQRQSVCHHRAQPGVSRCSRSRGNRPFLSWRSTQ